MFKHDDNCPVCVKHPIDEVQCQCKDQFYREKLALEYCNQYNINDDSPERDAIINAFIVGITIGEKRAN